MSKSVFKTLKETLIKFRNARDWAQLALALSIEAAELNECFLWKKHEDANKEKVAEELADVFAYALLLAHEMDLDVETIVKDKIRKNELKYPVEKSKGTAKKYNQL